jgi:phosphatidylinositol alpha-1,6-mannosyltransferase
MQRIPPRLVTVTHEFHPHRGGIAVYTAEMAAAAAELGFAVEVWAPALAAGQTDPIRAYPVRRLSIDGSHSVRNQWRMARELLARREQWQDAILYVPEPGPLMSMLVLQFFDILPPSRLRITLHGSEILKLAFRPLSRWSIRRLLARADRISVVSQHARDLLTKFFPNVSAKTVVTPGALRSEFARNIPSPAARRADSGSGKIVILTVARLHPRKGQHRVIEALQRLPPDIRARIEYWIVGGHGKERYEPKLRALAAKTDFPVKFLGDIPDEQLGGIYAQADIFAMTSMPHKFSVEGYGLVYLEAGAHGLPVVAHAIGGVPEAVLHERTGLLVSPDAPDELTSAFAKLIAEPALGQRLGLAGREHAFARTWRDNALTLFGQPPLPAST